MNVIKHKNKWYLQSETGYKEILLSTDDQLIKDGVQKIDDEFLEWFVKNPSCEFVKIDHERVLWEDGRITHYTYRVIIPKEEPKQDRTCTNNCSVVCGECQIFEPKQELSVRLQNSLKQFNLTLEDAINTEPHRLKQIGFGNRSIIELQSLKPKQETPEQHVEFINNNIEEFDKAVESFIQRKSKQETIEEVAERLCQYVSENPPYTIIKPKSKIEGFIEGYKLAQQQNKNKYSEEEVRNLLIEYCGEVSCEDGALVGKSPEELVKWIDMKLKKK